MRRGQRRLSVHVLLEPVGCSRLRVGLIAFWIKRRLPTFWRRQRYVSIRITKNIIRRSKFFEPKTGFLAGGTQFIMGRKNHQNFHALFLSAVFGGMFAKYLKRLLVPKLRRFAHGPNYRRGRLCLSKNVTLSSTTG